VNSFVYNRDPKVVAFVEERAQGKCELCRSAAPFNRPDGTPFLEVHHVIPISEGGEDTPENTAALCPNCHRACHYGVDARSHRAALISILSIKR
jgi:5-methylcytosine-specific restriction protein A